MEPAIDVQDLEKSYGGTIALDGLSFSVHPGEVAGLVGPNGAGKSTTMRILLGLERAGSGHAHLAGGPYRDLDRPLTRVGSLLNADAVHPGRKARDHLRWMAYSNGIPRARVGAVLDQVGLASVAGRPAGGFSLGMRQRLGIASALLGNPETVLFDEPLNGLDPEGIVWVRGLFRDLASQGRAVLVSSHLMSELEGTADRIIVVGRGRLIVDASVRDLLDRASGGRIDIRTDRQFDATTVLANAGATVAISDVETLTVTNLSAAEISSALTANGVPFSQLAPHRSTLEEAYMELTRESVEFGPTQGDRR